MRLHHADGGRVHASRGQRGPIGRDLCGPGRCRDVDCSAILVRCRAAYDSQNPVTIPLRIRQPLEQQNDASLADDEPIRRDVEGMTMSGRRPHTECRSRDEPPRIESQRDATR
ncbi:hypothetical protein MSIMFI_04788 [Mycobacterium simulans]|nr:hypothetical protein MSIMFI_04788 [Mycobacterium simulans]